MEAWVPALSRLFAITAFTVFASGVSASESDISLFDSHGRASAYVALDDELTIYLWSGEPAAYLSESARGGYDIYGFNGKHLGWFLNGVVWDHAGEATCATKDAIVGTQLEPLKSLKQLKPIRSIKELPPLRPILSRAFGDTPCVLLLGSGSD